MNKQHITIAIPQGLEGHAAAAQIEQEAKRFIAMKCYADKKITIGMAARYAGMNRYDFEQYLARYNVPCSLLEYNDVMADLEKMNGITVPAQ
jgi:predicted HTH domain antitoxin